jgi:beta-glucosidase
MTMMFFALIGTAAAAATVPNFHGCVSPNATGLPYCDAKLSIDARLEDLVKRLTLDEKIGLISPAHHTPSFSAGVPRLGVPIYNWLTEANTAIQAACAGPDRCPTQFPGPLNMASSFNRSNWVAKGTVLGKEQRALGNARDVECYGANCQIRNLPPLTAWGPNINIVRPATHGP